MNEKAKTALWIGGAAVIGGVLYLLTRSKNTVANSAAPYYRVYNIPGVGQSPTGTASGLPMIPAATDDDGGCGCTSDSGGSFYTSLNDMLSSFQQGATAAFQSYMSGVYNTVPDYAKQYQSNPVPAQASSNILTNPFQYAG